MHNTIPPVLELHGVSKSYTRHGYRHEVLHDISMTLDAGSIVLITGPSGSGKSSIVRIAGLLAYPDTGTVRLHGETLPPRQHPSLRRSKIGIVFQNANLLPELTVNENLQIAASPGNRGRCRPLLETWGLDRLASRRATELSGGEAQRVAFCRALVNRPDVLLLDEPSASLDKKNVDLMIAMIMQSREDRCGVLLVSHDPGMREVADQVIVIEEGHRV